MSFGLVAQRQHRIHQWWAGIGFRGYKWQRFIFSIRNSGGTLQCAFFDTTMNASTPPRPELCDRVLFASNEWRALPAVGAGTAFGNVGAGTVSGAQYLLFNTRPQYLPSGQGSNSLAYFAKTMYFNPNTTRITPLMYVGANDVLGSGNINRPTMLMCNDFSAGFPLFNTGQITSGNQINFDIGMYLL